MADRIRYEEKLMAWFVGSLIAGLAILAGKFLFGIPFLEVAALVIAGQVSIAVMWVLLDG